MDWSSPSKIHRVQVEDRETAVTVCVCVCVSISNPPRLELPQHGTHRRFQSRERAASTRKSAASARTQKGSLPMPFRSKLGQRALVENLESSDSVTVTRGSRNGPRASPAAEWGYFFFSRWVGTSRSGEGYPGVGADPPRRPALFTLLACQCSTRGGGARRSPARATGSSG